MDSGTNKGLFTLITVVIFGIFLSISYWLFQDSLKGVFADVMDKTVNGWIVKRYLVVMFSLIVILRKRVR